jgi:hypothetical protein
MGAWVVYMMLHVPFAPEGYRNMLYRMPSVRYETAEECREDAPVQAAAWLEMRERAGQGSIQIEQIICFDTTPGEPA